MNSSLHFIESKIFQIIAEDLLDFIKKKKCCYNVQLFIEDSGKVCVCDNNENIKFSMGDIIELVEKEIGHPIRMIVPSIYESNKILYFIEYVEPDE